MIIINKYAVSVSSVCIFLFTSCCVVLLSFRWRALSLASSLSAARSLCLSLSLSRLARLSLRRPFQLWRRFTRLSLLHLHTQRHRLRRVWGQWRTFTQVLGPVRRRATQILGKTLRRVYLDLPESRQVTRAFHIWRHCTQKTQGLEYQSQVWGKLKRLRRIWGVWVRVWYSRYSLSLSGASGSEVWVSGLGTAVDLGLSLRHHLLAAPLCREEVRWWQRDRDRHTDRGRESERDRDKTEEIEEETEREKDRDNHRPMQETERKTFSVSAVSVRWLRHWRRLCLSLIPGKERGLRDVSLFLVVRETERDRKERDTERSRRERNRNQDQEASVSVSILSPLRDSESDRAETESVVRLCLSQRQHLCRVSADKMVRQVAVLVTDRDRETEEGVYAVLVLSVSALSSLSSLSLSVSPSVSTALSVVTLRDGSSVLPLSLCPFLSLPSLSSSVPAVSLSPLLSVLDRLLSRLSLSLSPPHRLSLLSFLSVSLCAAKSLSVYHFVLTSSKYLSAETETDRETDRESAERITAFLLHSDISLISRLSLLSTSLAKSENAQRDLSLSLSLSRERLSRLENELQSERMGHTETQNALAEYLDREKTERAEQMRGQRERERREREKVQREVQRVNEVLRRALH